MSLAVNASWAAGRRMGASWSMRAFQVALRFSLLAIVSPSGSGWVTATAEGGTAVVLLSGSCKRRAIRAESAGVFRRDEGRFLTHVGANTRSAWASRAPLVGAKDGA